MQDDLVEANTKGFHSKGQIYMLVISVLISALVALFVLRRIISIWKKGKVVQKRAEEEALLQQAQGSRRNRASLNDGHSQAAQIRNGLTEGQRFKFAFLIGLFLTNLLRCIILLYDGLSHSVFE